jgi:mannitol/fructose-specific phosphotransferase system IIA component (Ntr-type)
MSSEVSAVAALNTLADFTRPELIVARLRESDPAGIIEELSRQFRAQGVVADVLSFYHAAINQEFLSNSATPAGFALPHARSPQVGRVTLAIGRVSEPVIWGLRGSWPVETVFLIAVPPSDTSDYLALRSGLASLGRQEAMLARLRTAADAHEIFGLLKGIGLPPG